MVFHRLQVPQQIEIFFEVKGKYLTFHTERETVEANPEGHTSVFIDFYPGRAVQENKTIYFVPSMLGKFKTNRYCDFSDDNRWFD